MSISYIGMPVSLSMNTETLAAFGYGCRLAADFEQVAEEFSSLVTNLLKNTCRAVLFPQIVPLHSMQRMVSSKSDYDKKIYRESLLPGKWKSTSLQLLPLIEENPVQPIQISEDRYVLPMVIPGYIVGEVDDDFLQTFFDKQYLWSQRDQLYMKKFVTSARKQLSDELNALFAGVGLSLDGEITPAKDIFPLCARHAFQFSLTESSLIGSLPPSRELHLGLGLENDTESLTSTIKISISPIDDESQAIEIIKGDVPFRCRPKNIIESLVYHLEEYEDLIDLSPLDDTVVDIMIRMGNRKRRFRK